VLTIFLRKTGGVCTPTAFLLKVKKHNLQNTNEHKEKRKKELQGRTKKQRRKKKKRRLRIEHTLAKKDLQSID